MQAETSVGADDNNEPQDNEQEDEPEDADADMNDAVPHDAQAEPQPEAHGEKGQGSGAAPDQQDEASKGDGGDRSGDEQEQDKAQSDNSVSAPEQSVTNKPEESQVTDEGDAQWQPVEPDQANADGDQAQPQSSQPQRKPDMEMNPYRDPGDASRQWQRRLQIIEREMTPTDADDADNEKAEEGVENDPEMPDQVDSSKAYEFTKNSEASSAQALGAAPPDMEQEEQETQAKEPEDEQHNAGDADAANDVAMDDAEEVDETSSKDETDDSKITDDVTSTRPRGALLQKPKAVDEMQDADEIEDDAADSDTQMEAAEDARSDQDGDDFDRANSEIMHVHDADGTDDMMDSNDTTADAVVSESDLEQLHRDLEDALCAWGSDSNSVALADELWARFASVTEPLAQQLCEQLRLVLEPTQRSKMRGDFRTGKRINMRKVITYIASQYRKDKIWMRRSAPSKRQYQIVLAIDDSESMMDKNTNSRAGPLALQSLATMCQAMTRLEVGDIGVVKFGESVELLHALGQPWDSTVGARTLSAFKFNQKRTHVPRALDFVLRMLDQAGGSSGGNQAPVPLQLAFFITDGILHGKQDRDHVRRLARDAAAKQQLLVLVMLDRSDKGKSITETQTCEFIDGVLVRTSYLDGYPFPYYILLRDMAQLPEVLADALRQWFEMIQSSDG